MKTPSSQRPLSALDRHLGRRAPEEIRFATGKFALGHVLVAASPKGIVSILVGGDETKLGRDLVARWPRVRLFADPALKATWGKRVIEQMNDPGKRVDLPLDLRGTEFQRQVWLAVCQIPAGQTRTYAAIAAVIGAPKAIRAVGSACARNPLALVIPCHRVLHSNGSMSGGHHWGIGQQVLIDRERAPLKPTKRKRPH